jgi:hypothetical protein
VSFVKNELKEGATVENFYKVKRSGLFKPLLVLLFSLVVLFTGWGGGGETDRVNPAPASKDAFMSWDEFRDAVVQYYEQNHIAGKHSDLKDKEITEVAPKYRDVTIKGYATYNGVESEMTDEGQIIKLNLLTPLEPQFTVTCRTAASDAPLWKKLKLGSKVQFSGTIKMVGTGYFTMELPFGGQKKRVQVIAIIISSVKPI